MPAANGHPPASPPPGTTLALSSFSDTTPVVIDAADAPLALTVDDVLTYVAPGAPRAEALLFLMTCKQLRLNPLAREAYLLSLSGGKWSTVVSKSGYLRAAQRHESYNGHDAGIIGQEFNPQTKARGPVADFPGTFLPPGHVVLGGWAKVWRKGLERPIEARVSLVEYGKDAPGPWRTLTCTMIRKVALVHAIREAFAMGGYDEAEMPAMPASGGSWATEAVPTSSPTVEVRATPPEPNLKKALEKFVPPREDRPARVSPATAARLTELMDRASMSDYQRNVALTKRGVDRVEDLDEIAATHMIHKLEATLSVQEWDPLNDKGKEATTQAESPTDGAVAATTETVTPTARVRAPGDDDEPFDDATGKVLSDPAEIAAEFDRPIDEVVVEELKAARKGGKEKAATAAK